MLHTRIFMLIALLALAASGVFNTARAQIGSLDPAFNVTGTATHLVQDWGLAHAVSLAPDGSVITIGHAETVGVGVSREGVLNIFDPEGNVEATHTYPHSVFLCGQVPRAFLGGTRLDNGQFLTAGFIQTTCGGLPRMFEVIRIHSNGGVDLYFELADFHGQHNNARNLTVQPDDKVVSVGFASTSGVDTTSYDVALARHNPDGTLDATFGNDGEVTFDIQGDWDLLDAVAVQDDGRIVAGGFATTTNERDFLLLRLHPDGSTDTDFGTGGIVILDFHGFDDRILDIALQKDGKIVVAGRSTAADGDTVRFTVARFLPSGALDNDFADSGIALIEFGGPLALATSLAIDPGGRIHVAGTTETGAGGLDSRQVAVAVLRPDGTLNPAFDGDGITLFEYGVGPIDSANAIDIDPIAGRIAVAGYSGQIDSEGDRFWEIAAARLIGFPDAIFADRFE